MEALVVPGSSRKNYWQRRVENDRLIAAALEAGIQVVIEQPMIGTGYDRLVSELIAIALYLR